MYHYYSIVISDEANPIGMVSVSPEDDGGVSIDVRPDGGNLTCCALHLGPKHAKKLYKELGYKLGFAPPHPRMQDSAT